MSLMTNKASKNTKNSTIKKQQQFLKKAKQGAYGPVEVSSIAYVRMTTQAQPVDKPEHQNLYFGIR